MIAGAIFGFEVLGPNGHAGSARAQDVDRAGVVQRFIDARNAGDVDAALATFTANALYVGPGQCVEATPCVGADAVRRNLEILKSGHSLLSVVSMQVSGGAVTGQFESRSDASRAAGVDRTVSSFIAQVPQDKIADWLQVSDLTDPQTAQYVAIQGQAQQAGASDREPGPYAVGVTRRTFVRASSTTDKPRYLNTVIWYPADASAESAPRNGMLSAPLDAVPARSAAPYPVILYSHGSGVQPWSSSFMTSHLASYGFVVIAPPHPGNTADTCPVPCIPSNPSQVAALADSAANRPDDIGFALDQALSLSATNDALLAGLLDGNRVGITGQSFGSNSTVIPLVARNGRFLAGIATSPGTNAIGLQAASAVAAQVTRPLLIMAGALDDNASFPDMQSIFAALPATAAAHVFVAFQRGGHFNFEDFCPPGRAGCRSGDISAADAHVRINRWATAFLLRYVAGDDLGATSLEAVLAQDDPEVQVTHSP